MDAVDSMAQKLNGTFLGTEGDDTIAAPLAPTMAMRPPTMMQPPTTSAADAAAAGQQAPIAPPHPLGWWARLRVWLHDTFGGDDFAPPEQVPTAHHVDVTFGAPAALEAHPYYRDFGPAPIVAGEGLGVDYDTTLKG